MRGGKEGAAENFTHLMKGVAKLVLYLSTINEGSVLKMTVQMAWIPHNHGEGSLLTCHSESEPKCQVQRCLSRQVVSCSVPLDLSPLSLA